MAENLHVGGIAKDQRGNTRVFLEGHDDEFPFLLSQIGMIFSFTSVSIPLTGYIHTACMGTLRQFFRPMSFANPHRHA